MGDATTVYDVITRYIVETPGGGAIGRYDQSVNRLSDSMARNERLSAAMGRGLTRLSPAYLAVGGAVGGAAFGAAALSASVKAANHELNNTLDLAGGIHGRFQFATDGAENFKRSVVVSRNLIRDITADTAGFGKRSDFIDTTSRLSGDVAKAGGSIATLRGIVGSLAVVSRMADASPQGAGSQVSGMLDGRGRGAIFQMLGARGLLPHEDTFKKLPSATRLRLVSDGLAKMADNPALKAAFARTLENQAERFKSTMFTVATAFGDGPLDPLLDAFVSANNVLAKNVDPIVENIFRISDEFVAAGAMLKKAGNAVIPEAGGYGVLDWMTKPDTLSALKYLNPFEAGDWLGKNVTGPALGWIEKSLGVAPDRPRDGLDAYGMPKHIGDRSRLERRLNRSVERMLEQNEGIFFGDGEGKGDSNVDPLKGPKALVNQTINIKVDAKTDISPEALAVRISKVVGKELRMPTQGKRGPGPVLGPGAGVARK